MTLFRTTLLVASLSLTGCSTLHLSAYTQDKDPLEPINRKVYVLNDTLDRALIKPVAQGYDWAMPAPAKTLVNNFFSNLDDVTVTANDLLQLKFAQAASDGSRVLFNSTFGIGGLINVTTRLEKHNEDFGQTLGYWGVPSGAYLMLPVFGPSSLRDGVGLYGDTFVSVIGNTQHVPTRNTVWALDKLNTRAGLLEQEAVMQDATLDRYSFMRDAYLMRRQSLVYDGSPPRINYEEDDEAP
jgi:phospholipid-binding lipoprotein MlaA